MSVSFGANFKNFINVGKLQPSAKTYEQIKTSFVEIDPLCNSDVLCLSDIAKYWENDKFAGNISICAKILNKSKAKSNIKIYALTSQNDTFEKLNPDKILGVIETEILMPKKININKLQVKPDFVYSTKPEYKGAGTSILNSLKKFYNKITLKSEPEKSVQNFYEKNNFIRYNNDSNLFIWEKSL